MKYKPLLVLLFVAMLGMLSCDKIFPDKDEDIVEDKEAVVELSLNGSPQEASSAGIALSYEINPDAPGAYKVMMSGAFTMGESSNLFFSVWCYDIHNPIAGGIRAKKYFIEYSRLDCREYFEETLCDGAEMTLQLTENEFVTDFEEYSSYINISVCDPKEKLISGNASVRTFLEYDHESVQVITLSFENIPYRVLN